MLTAFVIVCVRFILRRLPSGKASFQTDGTPVYMPEEESKPTCTTCLTFMGAEIDDASPSTPVGTGVVRVGVGVAGNAAGDRGREGNGRTGEADMLLETTISKCLR